MRWFFFLFMLLCVGAVFAAGVWGYGYWTGKGPLTMERNVVIKPGTPVGEIASLLSREQVLKHPLLFRAFIKAGDMASDVKAGEYRFEAGVSPEKILKKLREGDVFRRSVTIPEGWTTGQILVWLEGMTHLSGEVPKDVKEGELLPETYDYLKGQSRASLVERMRQSMQETLAALWKDRAADLPVATPEEALILASVVEKETGRPEERHVVAAVFVNRLRKNMRLQSDPTTIYAITKGQYVLDRPLSRKDLALQDPYNTYTASGLPPGPICNPGRSAIEAALHPADSSAVYFVSDGDGNHRFSDSLKEHNSNVQKLRAVERKRKREANEKEAEKVD